MINRMRNAIGLLCLLVLGSGQAVGAGDCSAVAGRLESDLQRHEDLKGVLGRYNQKVNELAGEQSEIAAKFFRAGCLIAALTKVSVPGGGGKGVRPSG